MCGLACVCYSTRKVKEDNSDYLTFPDDPLLAQFPHEWVMVPHRRPHVPVFNRSKLPRASTDDEEKGRLCSLYFRPWSLCQSLSAPPHVPHLLQLPLFPEPEVRRRARQKRKARAEESMPSWASSWARYIRGNVVSQHAAQLIRRFLSLTLSRSGGDGGESDDSASEAGEDDGHAAAPVSVALEEARKIMTIDAEKASKRSRAKRDIRARWSRNS